MNIMISYRRADSGPITGRIYDRLQAHFGPDHVFIDIDSIPMGIDYRHHIDNTIKRCDVLLPVIGPHWTGPGEVGKRRIDDPHDLVRLEVAHALERNIRVIPLLIEDAGMPRTDELPDDLKSLRLRNSLRVDSGIDFHHHISRLCSAIERAAQEAMAEGVPERDEAPPSTQVSDVSKAAEAQKAPDRAAPAPTTIATSLKKLWAKVEIWTKSALSSAQLVFGQFRKSKFYLPAVAAVALFIAFGAILYFILRHPSRAAVPVQAERSQTPAAPTKKPSVSHVPLANGALVQREELSPSGNLRVKYTRSKGNPVHQIVLESVEHPDESKVFFEYQRNAWVLISPDDQWIALNNRPGAGQSELKLYQHQEAGPLDYDVAGDTGESNEQLDQIVWKYYLQELGLPPETPRDGVAIDAVGWDADSKKLAVTVTATPSTADDQVLPPWRCVVNVDTGEIDVTPEAIQAFNGQQAQMTGVPVTVSASPIAGQPGVGVVNSNKPLEGDFSGERYQETRARLLTADEVSHWNLTNIRYAIDEIYARRGSDFSDKSSARKQFSKFAWYKPRAGVSNDQIDSELTDVEKQNIQTLEKARDQRQRTASTSKSKEPTPPQILKAAKHAWDKIFSPR